MSLSCGLVGLPNVGKTTIFGAITQQDVDRSEYMFSTTGAIQGTVDVPDDRLPRIAEHITTEKIVPAQMRVVDIPGLVSGSSKGEGMGISFLGSIKDSDVLLHVVRCFERSGVQHVSGKLDPAGDAEIVDMELGQADLGTLERNLERSAKKLRTGDKSVAQAVEVYERAKAHLESDQPLRSREWSETERKMLQPLFLMTIKPILFVANVGDDDIEGASERVAELRDYAQRSGDDVLPLCGDLEAELVRMEPDEAEVFMADLGLRESGLAKLIHRGFDLLGLQTFFTAGEKEVRAWVIRKGDSAPQGAGVIHTDFVRQFIRAEVYTFDDLMEHQSETAIKAAGRLRVEGKDYALQDGDICHFLVGK
ncbi:MAG: redox-regulated ATPase YchF [Planctomycetota bacterium]